jgi:hypothetical protein
MKCPKCGAISDDAALMCKKCSYHFDEPYFEQINKKRSALWWIVLLAIIAILLTILTSAVLYWMVFGF